MKKEVKSQKSSGIPLAIIVGVLVVVIGGAWWFYNSSTSRPAANRSTATNTSRQPVNTAAAPAGAQPPNMLGSPTASVTVEEFADFQCPACASTDPVLKEIQSIYGSKIKFVYRNFPLQMHDKAYDASVAAEAAGMQGSDKFWAMKNLLYQNQSAWANNANFRALWSEYAQRIGLDLAKWQSDMAGMQAKTRVDEDMKRGRAFNVPSTPSVYVNGVLVPAPEMNVASMRLLIDAELQKTAAGTQQNAAPANK